MKRSTFLSLMLSPLIAPFVGAGEQKIVYPNGSEVYFRPGLGGITNDLLSAKYDTKSEHYWDSYNYYRGDRWTEEEFQRFLNQRSTSVYEALKINRIT